MRISKLARNYDLSIQELTDYLETLNIPGQSLHPNAKLSEDTIEKVALHFDFVFPEEKKEEIIPKIGIEEQVPDKPDNPDDSFTLETVDAKVDEDDSEPIELHTSASQPKEEVVESEPEEEVIEPEPTSIKDEDETVSPPTDDQVILSDQLLEMIESEEVPEDLEKIRLIKAPKKELSGLKVLGKIEVPEDPRKKSKEQKEAEKKADALKKPGLSDEEKEERRLRAKRKKEAFEARKEERKKRQEVKEEKARKAAHYKKTIHQKKAVPKPKPKKKVHKVAQHSKHSAHTKPQPKTWLGKFWKWLNSSGYE